jgi:alpha-L-fucosidase 2
MRHSQRSVTRRSFLAGAAALASTAGHQAFAEAASRVHGRTSASAESEFVLHFAQPASKWPNALPVGNGRLGAVVFGEPGLERIQLNEESIWDGEPNRDRTNPKAGEAIPRIRELLFAGQIAEAEALAVSDVLSVPRRMPCYQTLGDLHLDFTPMGLNKDAVVQDYRLQLDLDTAIVTTSFAWQGVRYTREVFASAPDQVIVVRLTADQAGKISLSATLDRPRSFVVARPSRDRLTLSGQALPYNDNPDLPVKEHQTGVRFFAQLHALLEGGQFQSADQTGETALQILNATAVTLFLDCATSYRYPAHAGKLSGVDADVLTGNPDAMRAAVERNLRAAARRPYAQLRERHITNHQQLFRRASFTLGPDPQREIATDVRVERMKGGAEDVHLLPVYFQYGRYMLISSSRPGTLAANLQGIWNESVDPPWGSKYTVNINAEMNYWFAESANLSDCHLPLFDLLHATRAQGTRTAQALYKARGTVVHHNTDLWGDAGPIDGLGGGVWAMGSNWLSLHLWTHYTYTGDRRFLLEYAYPALRENAIFLLDYLVRDPHTGHLTTGPSCSPENAYELPDGHSYNLCMGPTMDISITRSVFARLLEAASLLSEVELVQDDAGLLRRVRSAWAQLPPFQIAPDGRLQEWQVDYKDHEPGHRHISHLFGLFPEDQITPAGTPALAQAARKVLDRRLAAGSGSTGWSRSWIINCMARLGDGEAAYQNIRELFRQSIRPNLFDVCGLKENSPFQIDGNLGAPNGFIEMLLQSHGETPLEPPSGFASPKNVTLRLLPALPKAWPTGNFRGLRTRGGLELDCTWNDGRFTTATLKASLRKQVRIVLPKHQGEMIALRNGKRVALQKDGEVFVLAVEPGSTYHLQST